MAAIITRRNYGRIPAYARIDPRYDGAQCEIFLGNAAGALIGVNGTALTQVTSDAGFSGQRWVDDGYRQYFSPGDGGGDQLTFATLTDSGRTVRSTRVFSATALSFHGNTTRWSDGGDAYNSRSAHACHVLTDGSLSKFGYDANNGYYYYGIAPAGTIQVGRRSTIVTSFDPNSNAVSAAVDGIVIPPSVGSPSFVGNGTTGTAVNWEAAYGGYTNYYLFDGYIHLWARLIGVYVDQGEAAAISANPSILLRPRTRRLYFGATGGGVTVALTGQSATVGQGAFGPRSAVVASGLSATSAEGALAPVTAAPIAGQAAVFTGGQLLPDLRASLSGQSLAASGGVFGVSLAPSLAGVTSTATSGSLANALAVALAGEAATLAQGTLTASTGSNVTVALTGLAATLALGAFGPVASIGLAGEAAAASGGAVGLGTAASLTGQTAGAAQGALAPQVGITLAGEAANASAGFLAPSLAAYLSGETINSYYGLVTVGGQVLTPDPFFVVPTLSRSFHVPTLTRQFRVS